MEKEEVTLLGAEALKQLTITVVKANGCKAPNTGPSNGRPAKKEECHARVLHSVRQDENAVGTPISSAPHPLAPVCTVSSPSPCGFPRRQLSSSVDCSPPLMDNCSTFTQVEPIEECRVVGVEQQVCRPCTLSLRREVSTTSSGGSGKTTPCNIPERNATSRSSPKESLVSTYPPSNTTSFGIGSMQVGMATSVDRQPQCHVEGGIHFVHRQALARKIAEKLRTMGDQLASETDLQQVEDLLESITSDACASWSWFQVARIFRGLSHILARYVDGGSDLDAWNLFSDIWKTVLRNLFGLIAENGGWQSFMRWAESDDPPHPALPTSFTPDLGRRRNTIDALVHYSTPQVPRRNLPVTHSTPFLTSTKGIRVLSLTEDGVFQMEDHVSFQTGSGQETQDEDIQGQDDATFGSLSSFSDMSGSPTSIQPRSLLLEEDQSLTSAFDRNRSRSMPCRRRPRSASTHTRPMGLERTEVIAEQDRSVDSGLEALSEASLTSADSCTSLNYSRLGVSATCILEAVRSMLLEK